MHFSERCDRPDLESLSLNKMLAGRLASLIASTAFKRGGSFLKGDRRAPTGQASLRPTLVYEMSAFIETLINGLLLGALYALFGLGLSISLGVMRMINIAHGDLIVVGAYITSVVMEVADVHALASLFFVAPIMFIIGWVLQRALFNHVIGRSVFAPLLVTFGLSIVVQNLLQETFTADTRSLRAENISQIGFDIGGVSIGLLPLVSAGVSAGLFALTHAVIASTHYGRQSRAVADDPSTARLVGVDDKNFFAIVTGFVMAAIAFAAVLYAIRTPFSPTAGPDRLLYSFEAVVLGGLGNLWGTFFGGLVIGVAQLFGARVSSGLGPFFGHLVFLTMLLARPQGLFAKVAR
jgi:branched-chain amino acid transport system permease protein